MSQAERPAYLPHVPERFARTNYVPAPAPVADDDQSAPTPTEPAAPVAAEPERSSTTGPGSREKQPYVTFTGRVAARPAFRTTSKSQQLVATFPLAVHEVTDGEVITTYQRCVAFGKWAEKVKETVRLGEELEVHGYRHEGTTKGGTPKVEYYIGALRRPRGISAGE